MIMTAVDTWTIMKSVLMISLKMAISLLHEQRYSFVTMLTLPQVHLASLCQKLSPSIFSLVTCTGVVIGVALLGIISQMAMVFIRVLSTVLFLRLNNLLKTIFLIFVSKIPPMKLPLFDNKSPTQDIVVCFVLAAGHNVGGVLLSTNSDDIRWYLAYIADFVNKDDPEKIRNAITASSVSCSQNL